MMRQQTWWVAAIALTVAASGQEPMVETASTRLRLDPAAGYAVAALTHRGLGVEFVAEPAAPAADRSPWSLALRDLTGRVSRLTAADAATAGLSPIAGGLEVVWRQVGAASGAANLTVTATITARDDGLLVWRLVVTGQASAQLWQVDFPRLCGLAPAGEQWLVEPHYLGRLTRQPAAVPRGRSLLYPQPASMQFAALYATSEQREPPLPSREHHASETGWLLDRSDAAGLYWAAEDGQARIKRLAFRPELEPGRLAVWFEQLPELPGWPPATDAGEQFTVDYTQPYPIAVGCYTGDHREAALLYRRWAEGQDWCQRGPAETWPSEQPAAGSEALTAWVPNWFREIGFWAKFYHEPAKVLPEWAAYRRWLRVPVASHWYRYNVAIFDDNYPEHLPADPYFLTGTRTAKQLGVRPLPYINGVIWDTDTQSWIRENGAAAALRNEAGELYLWDLAGGLHAYMNPAVQQWRQKMIETTGKLVGEHGVSGVYLDCLAATSPRLNYDPNCGHALHGGADYAQGNRQLMRELRAATRLRDPEAAFFTEEIGEAYLDVMDGFLTLDQLRSSPSAGQQVFPLFNWVYHPYAINFGCDAALGQAPDFFCWQMGQMMTWGAQPLNSTMVAREPQPGDPASEFLREVCGAYTVAARPLVGGGWPERLTVRPAEAPPSTGLELISSPHQLSYELRRDVNRLWSGPAVMGSAWRRDGDLGLVLINITGDDQSVTLNLPAGALGVAGNPTLLQTWPQPTQRRGAVPTSLDLTVPAQKIVVLVVSADAAGTEARLGQLDPIEWEFLSVTATEPTPLGEVTGPAGSLFACSDGPVGLRLDREASLAAPQAFGPGWLEAVERTGYQAAVTGVRAEGRGLPRAEDAQPFALLRRLPHTLQPATTGELALVLSGDADHLLAVVGPGSRLRFARSGFLAVSQAGTGELVRPVTAGRVDQVALPATGGPFLVGWASVTPLDVGGATLAAGPAISAAAATLGELYQAIDGGPSALAGATAAVPPLLEALGSAPGLLVPETPLRQLLDRLRAVTVATVAGELRLTVGDRWLAPLVDKPLTSRLVSAGNRLDWAGGPRLVPVGSWSRAGLRVIQPAPRAGSREQTATISLTDGLYVERLVPLIGSAKVAVGGLSYTLWSVLELEANRPYELRPPKTAATVVAGQTGSQTVLLRNASPVAVTARLHATGPSGWRVGCEPETVELAALSEQSVRVILHPSPATPAGSFQVRVTSNHGAAESTACYADLAVSVLPALVPLGYEPADWQPAEPLLDSVIRHRGQLVVWGRKDHPLQLELQNARITIYTTTLKYRLLGPDLTELAQGQVPVDQAAEIDLVAPVTGPYYVELEPGPGSVRVRTRHRWVGEVATAREPFQVIGSPMTRWFHVPPGAREFALAARDGGPDEVCQFIITSPTGRVALDISGRHGGFPNPVEVRPGEDNGLWRIDIKPAQDVMYWLTGEVAPVLADAPERVLRLAD